MPVAPLDPADPRSLGGYRLLGRLGEGGQGVVFLGADEAGRQVAVKVLAAGADDKARERFAREMAAARQVAPFCTARVLDASVDGARPYVVSEFVDGPSLKDRVDDAGPLRAGDLERLVVNTATALTAIHGAGIIHRDFKPANVLLGPDGPRVVDFGIARATDSSNTTGIVGTPAYFAPEQLHGDPPSPAQDVFAWAGTMVFAATGRPPFGSDALPAVFQRILNQPPELAGVPAGLADVLARCLDKDPARRPTARDLMVRLVDPSAAAVQPAAAFQIGPGHGFQPTTPYPAGSPGPPQDTPPSPAGGGRGRQGLVLGSAVLAIVVLAAGGWLLSRSLGSDSAPHADRSPTVTGSAGPSDPTDSTGSTDSPASTTSAQASETPAATGGPAIPAAFAGAWSGTIRQDHNLIPGSVLTSDVTITLAAGKGTGEAVYGDWGCTLALTLTRSEATVLTFTEVSDNLLACSSGDTMTLTLSGGTLRYKDVGGPSGEIATGTLSRASR